MSVPARQPQKILVEVAELEGWDAIAGATGRGVTWCREMASTENNPDPMPVHRIAGTGRVFARRSAIREWLLRQMGLSGLDRPDD